MNRSSSGLRVQSRLGDMPIAAGAFLAMLSRLTIGHLVVTLPDGAPAYKDADHLRPRYTREEASYFDRTVRSAPAQQPSR